MDRVGKRVARRGRGLPHLLLFSDPSRTPDLRALAKRTPRGAALVYRGYGELGSEAVARRLKGLLQARGAYLVVGGDWRLAVKVGAAGVHLPQALAHLAPRLRGRFKIVTAAAHSLSAARVKGPHAVVVSTVFASLSPSASKPMGPIRLAMLVRSARRPIYALGGVANATAGRLLQTGVIGLAGIDGFKT